MADAAPDTFVEDPRQQWGTPGPMFANLHAEFRFTVDACALRFNAKLPRFWTPEDNGLRQSWRGERVWSNNPYDDIEPWLAKAREADLAVFLIPVRSDRPWWHRYVLNTRYDYFRGRVAFEPPPGVKASSNREPSCLVIFGAGYSAMSIPRSRCNKTGLVLPRSETRPTTAAPAAAVFPEADGSGRVVGRK